MIVCHTCQTANLPGAFFCAECGASFLPASKGHDTTSAIGIEFTSDAPSTVAPVTPQALERHQPVLRVVILNSGRKLSFDNPQPILIGRPDRANKFFPDIDLSADGGLEAGVSRRHARLISQEHTWFIEDLQSANGTFVNKQRVSADAPHPVHDGDEIRLGNILLRLELATILS